MMIPYECFFKIFNYFRNDYKNLFSCLLVNRQWCRIIVPILWSEPSRDFSDPRLIKIYLLALNVEERARLTPFKIIFPNYPRPLFDYSTFTTHVGDLYDGIKYWLDERREKDNYCTQDDESANAVYDSLVTMFLRTSKKLKYLTLNRAFNKIIFEDLCINTTITCLNFRSGYLDSKVIQRLNDIFIKNTTLSFLNLSHNQLGTGEE
ncbi:f-box domain-containing protein [Gigaspora margarita]|uniref:F-box domain-containing protein n=1 Tax=Gigaspora margarita TaxID=4874 RepID=A0A8H3X425_GIGMA|nr:f-box domain-containing protein [Gigaspora margarita]